MKLKYYLQAARPRTLIASVFPVVSALLLAFTNGYFKPLVALATLLCALGLQVLTNYANDYYDFIKGADTSLRVGPERVTERGFLSLSDMKQVIMLLVFLNLLVGVYLVMEGGFVILLIGILSIIFAIGYTAGPFPLAYLGLGEVFSFLFFGWIASFGTVLLQTENLSIQSLAPGTLFGFLSVALICANNLRDEETDKKANKKTIVVRFGESFGKNVFKFSIYSTLIFVPIFIYLGYLPWATLLIFLSTQKAFTVLQFMQKYSKKELMGVFPLIIQYYIIYGLLLTSGQCLNIFISLWN